jgi:glycosyltransferase 2 family protein
MLLITMPIVYLATVLPIAPGGLGIRESVLVMTLGTFSIVHADAALLAIAVFLNRVLVGLVGGLLFIGHGGVSHLMPAHQPFPGRSVSLR